MSRLETISKDFRKENLVRNSCRHTEGDEYDETSKDTKSDGDDKGREPLSATGTVGTNIDISCRGALINANSNRYTPGHEYNESNA